MGAMYKRGAIELSMTTIIVIVIGITLLSLGLLWVRSTFQRISTLTESQFDNAQQIIDATPITDEKLSVPLEINIKVGETKGFRMYLNNDGSGSDSQFDIKLINNDNPVGVIVGIIGAKPDESKLFMVDEGRQKEIDGLVMAKNSAKPGSYTYNVLVNNGEYEEKGFVVIVSK
ncbi:MAG: hypothetical protein AABW41_04625 [Nanoarchaeota archaeon]